MVPDESGNGTVIRKRLAHAGNTNDTLTTSAHGLLKCQIEFKFKPLSFFFRIFVQ